MPSQNFMADASDLTNVATIDIGGSLEMNFGKKVRLRDILIVGESSSEFYSTDCSSYTSLYV